jgi:hypothetical protein
VRRVKLSILRRQRVLQRLVRLGARTKMRTKDCGDGFGECFVEVEIDNEGGEKVVM